VGVRDRKILIEKDNGAAALAQQQQAREAEAQPSRLPLAGGNFTTFEEAMFASGMLDDRPPVPAGLSGHSFYTVQPMQLLSFYPRAYILPKFMDAKRCADVIGVAVKELAPSGLAFKAGDNPENTKNVRTSEGTFLTRDRHETLAWIEDKIGGSGQPPPAHALLRLAQSTARRCGSAAWRPSRPLLLPPVLTAALACTRPVQRPSRAFRRSTARPLTCCATRSAPTTTATWTRSRRRSTASRAARG
jgi:hypothetical protein